MSRPHGTARAAAAALALAGVLAAAAATRSVVIKAVMYAPADLKVSRGDVVVWKNEDPVPHTVTADRAAFDSGSIAPGGTWRYLAKHRGTYAYHCTLHPNMHGTLTVQ